MSPFILLGRIIAAFKPLDKKYNRFFFFPFYHIGGAEKIHYQVLEAVGDENCIIFFTRQSKNDGFLHEFTKSKATIRNIAGYTDNKFLYFANFIYRGIISGYVNSRKSNAIVFNGQCNFAYKLSPWISSKIKQYELVHALNTFAFIRLPYLDFYHQSITVSQEIIDKHFQAYQKNNVPARLFQQFTFVPSCIKLPPAGQQAVKPSGVLNVLYVGRATADKRPWIYIQVAQQLSPQKNIRFLYAGEMDASTRQSLPGNMVYLGEIGEEEKLYATYGGAHVVVIPSATESGPLVFMEAMAKGCAIVATPVGYMPLHIKKDVHGLLTSSVTAEAVIVNEMCAYINKLAAESGLLQQICSTNIAYAFENFGIEKFYTAYRKLLQP
ncbi:MAG: glycosyltransferase family 4 protein [Ferruginibacter sp.]